MNRLTLQNGRYNDFPVRTKEIDPGDYIVEVTSDGGKIVIHKPGYKGTHDFQVCWMKRDGTQESTSHVDILVDIDRALKRNRPLGERLVRTAFDVISGIEPPVSYDVEGTMRPGDCLLKLIKWILAEEDVNYPIHTGKQGRKMFADRLSELVQGVQITEVIQRANIRLGPPPERLRSIRYDYRI